MSEADTSGAVARAVMGAAVAVTALGTAAALLFADGPDRPQAAGTAAFALVVAAPLAAAGAIAATSAGSSGDRSTSMVVQGVVGAASGLASVLVLAVGATVALGLLTDLTAGDALGGVRSRALGWPLLITPFTTGAAAALATLGKASGRS